MHRFLFFALLFINVIVLQAQNHHFRIRFIPSMEPVGIISSDKSTGMGSSLSYGFSPGMDVHYILLKRVEFGLGFKWQFNRSLLELQNDPKVSCKPVYLLVRLGLDEFLNSLIYTTLKLGYSFFEPNRTFLNNWLNTDGNLPGTRGGLYASISLGVDLLLIKKKNYSLRIGLETAYSVHSVSLIRNNINIPITSKAMVVDFSIDLTL